MKKTIAMIYRLIFIIFSLWALHGTVDFFAVSTYSDITVISDALSLICVFLIFVFSIKSTPPDIILRLKAACAILAAVVLLSNYPHFYEAITLSWILIILLPAMMLLDWLLFDKKGSFRLYDIILWILAALGISALLNSFLKADMWNFLPLVIPALLVGTVIYLLDKLLSGGKNTSKSLSLLYRLIFLALQAYAFYLTAGNNITEFIKSLNYYDVLSNFLSFACVAVIVIYNLGSTAKKGVPLTRLKGCFTVMLTTVFIVYHFVLKVDVSAETLILCYICPLMMMFDWILFDVKGTYKAYDPFLWSIPTVMYTLWFYKKIVPLLNSLFNSFFYPAAYPAFVIISAMVVCSIVSGFLLFAADRTIHRFK